MLALAAPGPRRLVAALAALCCLGAALPAAAHDTGLSYLRIEVAGSTASVEIELGLVDAAAALGLPPQLAPDRLPEVAREELWRLLVARARELEEHVRQALLIGQDGAPCSLASDPAGLRRAGESGGALLRVHASCPGPIDRLGISWTLPFARDPQHRALVSVKDGDAIFTLILSARMQRYQLELRQPGVTGALASYFVEGVRHIASGVDHLLFLVALLLPAPLVWDGSRWSARPNAGRVVLEVVQTVTAFTVAHSITLVVSVLGAVRLPTAAIESAIAASIALAALNAIRPFLPGRAWRIAFVFGLLHGLAFARYLTALGLPGGTRVAALLAFNLGVETGQLGVVAICLPLLLAVGRRQFYRTAVLVPASAAIAALASLWVVQRLSAAG